MFAVLKMNMFCSFVCFFRRGQDKFSVVFEAFAFSLLNGKSCPGLQGASITGTYAVVESFRRRPDQMSGMKFNSR